jgi:hypothetical protein
MDNEQARAEIQANDRQQTVSGQIEHVVMWIDCARYDELPVGTWLARVDNERKPYCIVDVGENGQGHKIITSGGSFSWDMKPIKAYTDFIRYEST